MKTTGVVRGVDKNGRLVIPMEFRRQLDVVNDVDSFEIFMEEDKIILKKYQPGCIFCGEMGDTVKMNDHNVCGNCIERLVKMKSIVEETEEK